MVKANRETIWIEILLLTFVFSLIFITLITSDTRQVTYIITTAILGFLGLITYSFNGNIVSGEPINYFTMVFPFILLIGLAVHASTLSGFSDAMSYLFVADFDKINNTVILSAMSMAFFSLSIGMGSLMVYGSYLPEDTSIFQVSSAVAFFDTFVAILAGIIIFPIVFTYDLDPNSAGPGLIFQTLPIAFGAMDFGTLIATLFFILLFFAAITSSISIAPSVCWVCSTLNS